MRDLNTRVQTILCTFITLHRRHTINPVTPTVAIWVQL